MSQLRMKDFSILEDPKATQVTGGAVSGPLSN